MSTPSKFDIFLFGNATVDEVYEVDQWGRIGTSNTFSRYKTSIGGIGNLLPTFLDHKLRVSVDYVRGKDSDGLKIERYFQKYAHHLTDHLSSEPTSKALIIATSNKPERTSYVNWGCGLNRQAPSPVSARWGHCSYLDLSPSVSLKAVRDSVDILSADLCLSDIPKDDRNSTSTFQEKMYDNLKMLDYLFLSETEALSYNMGLRNFSIWMPGRIICHSKTQTTYVDSGIHIVKNENKLLDNVNVLGAGDIYAAAFISKKLKDRSTKECVAYAHSYVSKVLANGKND